MILHFKGIEGGTMVKVIKPTMTDPPEPKATVARALGILMPGLYESKTCPASGHVTNVNGWWTINDQWAHLQTIVSLIMHLNDEHKWTREQIADWLESLDVDLTFS